MLTYTIRRLISLAVSLVLISLLIFTVMRIIPGDPAQMMLRTEAEPETLEILRDKLGLDEPLFVQYFSWVRGMLTANLGDSLRNNVPISGLISSRLLVTAPLAVIATLLSVCPSNYVRNIVFSYFLQNKKTFAGNVQPSEGFCYFKVSDLPLRTAPQSISLYLMIAPA